MGGPPRCEHGPLPRRRAPSDCAEECVGKHAALIYPPSWWDPEGIGPPRRVRVGHTGVFVDSAGRCDPGGCDPGGPRGQSRGGNASWLAHPGQTPPQEVSRLRCLTANTAAAYVCWHERAHPGSAALSPVSQHLLPVFAFSRSCPDLCPIEGENP